MNTFLSNLHADIRRTRYTRRGATHDPKDVPRGTYKEYPRMERILLPTTPLTISLSDALLARSSSMKPGGETPLSLDDYGALFSSIQQRGSATHRNYPSGGGLYPVETYLFATSLVGASAGMYHYHPSAHALERLWNLPDGFEMHQLVSKPDWLMPSALIVFTSVWDRSAAKYGDLAYQHALLEAGHMSQNILLVSGALKLQSRPMAGFNDQRIIELLDLDEKSEQPVHSITLAKGSVPYKKMESELEE